MSIQNRIKEILSISDKSNREVKLRELAQELGCSLSSTHSPEGKHNEPEIIRRIQEAARSQRESRLWWIAVISAVASILSALAAWCAVLIAKYI